MGVLNFIGGGGGATPVGGANSGAKPTFSKTTDLRAQKARFTGGKEKFKKRLSEVEAIKRFGRIRTKTGIMKGDEMREAIAKKIGKTNRLSGKQLKKDLQEEYDLDYKTADRIVRGVAVEYLEPEQVGLTPKQYERLKRRNILMRQIGREREDVASGLTNRRAGKESIKDAEQTTHAHLGIENKERERSQTSALGGVSKKSGYAKGGSQEPKSLTGNGPGFAGAPSEEEATKVVAGIGAVQVEKTKEKDSKFIDLDEYRKNKEEKEKEDEENEFYKSTGTDG